MDDLLAACEAAGMLSMGVAVGIAVAAMILGYLVGARKELMKMLARLASASESAKDKGADGDDAGEDADGDEEEGRLEDILMGYMNYDYLGGLDDHADTEFNPIMMYQVKKSKEEVRQRKELIAKLVARGFEPDHLDSLDPKARAALIDELKGDVAVKVAGNVGSVAGKVRKYGSTQNSTAIMVKSGARFAKGGAGVQMDDAAAANMEAKKQQEARDRLRVIDMHLSQELGVDVARDQGKKSRGALGAHGLLKNALETAKETKHKPYGGERIKRQEEMATYASRGRTRVGAPLDHAITAKNEKDRRASCGGGRRASVAAKKKAADGE